MAKRKIELTMYANIGKKKTKVYADDDGLSINDLILFHMGLQDVIKQRMHFEAIREKLDNIDEMNKDILGD